MSQSISELLASDHRRLDDLFASSFLEGKSISLDRFEEFREGLLRHIGIEEKFLFPALRGINDPSVERLLTRLHADHAAIAAILVLPPTPQSEKWIETLLVPHNRIEEGADGLYELCDRLPSSGRLQEEAEAYPKVMLRPCNDTEVSKRNAERMFEEALKARNGEPP